MDNNLAREALEKIREQDQVIAKLRERLGIGDDLGSAIQKSVSSPTQNPRNRVVSDIVRRGIFTGNKVAKSKKSAAERREENRRELRKARLGHSRPSRYSKDGL